jgi:dynein heavy chain
MFVTFRGSHYGTFGTFPHSTGGASGGAMQRMTGFNTTFGMDVYTPWSKEDLASVTALTTNSLLAVEHIPTKSQARKIAAFMVGCHQDSLHRSSLDYKQTGVIPNKVTPSNLLHLTSLYMHHLSEQTNRYRIQSNRYKNGLSKLKFSEASIDQMNKDLRKLLPKINRISEETNILINMIEDKMPGIEQVRTTVREETEAAEKEAARVLRIQQECELSLQEALPMLEDATNALNTIKKNDISEVKSFRNPPAAVKLVMESVCIMLGQKPDKIPDPNDPSRKIDEWWSTRYVKHGVLFTSLWVCCIHVVPPVLVF